MIIVNGIEVKQEQFGDGTLKCEAVHGDEILANGNVIGEVKNLQKIEDINQKILISFGIEAVTICTHD